MTFRSGHFLFWSPHLQTSELFLRGQTTTSSFIYNSSSRACFRLPSFHQYLAHSQYIPAITIWEIVAKWFSILNNPVPQMSIEAEWGKFKVQELRDCTVGTSVGIPDQSLIYEFLMIEEHWFHPMTRLPYCRHAYASMEVIMTSWSQMESSEYSCGSIQRFVHIICCRGLHIRYDPLLI